MTMEKFRDNQRQLFSLFCFCDIERYLVEVSSVTNTISLNDAITQDQANAASNGRRRSSISDSSRFQDSHCAGSSS